jgi:hypothetical protein
LAAVQWASGAVAARNRGRVRVRGCGLAVPWAGGTSAVGAVVKVAADETAVGW